MKPSREASSVSMRGAVIYTRVSTAEQADSGTSLETQRAACLREVERLGLPLVACCEDAGVSGAKYQTRPGIQEALRLMESGLASTLIATKIDRIGRNAGIILDITQRIRAAGGALVTTDFRIDDTPMGQFTVTLFAGMAQMERDNIRERSLTGKAARVASGRQPASAMRPFGYQVVSKGDVQRGQFETGAEGLYRVVEEEAVWAREMFRRYAGGASMRALALWLRECGVEPIRGGKCWHPNTIAGILSNPLYKGQATWGKRKRIVDESRIARGAKRADYNPKQPKEQWKYIPAPALVDESTWDACQERIAGNKERLSGNNQRRHALTGLLKCPVCGRNMRSKKTRAYVHFHCRDYSPSCNFAGPVCHPKHYNAATLEAMAARVLKEIALRPEMLSVAMQAWRIREQAALPMDDTDALEARLRALDTQEKAVVKSQISGVMSGADAGAYDAAFAEIAEKRKTVRAGLEKARQQAEGGAARILSPDEVLTEVGRCVGMLEEVLTDHTLPMEKRHALLATVVERLVPNEDCLEVVLKGILGQTGQTVSRMVITLTVSGGFVVEVRDDTA